MRLTRNEHHRKLRVRIRDISDWLVNADVSDFCHPPVVSWRCTRPQKIAPPFVPPRLPAASHDYLLPPTTTYCLPRLPTTSHDYLLPPTTTCCLPLLPAASPPYLLPPTTPHPLPRLPTAPHDYLLPPTTTCWLAWQAQL